MSVHDGTHVPAMSPARRLRLGVALFTAAALLATGAAAQQPTPIPLGQLAPFTGSGGEFGEFYRDGAALAVEQINEAAEQVLGGPIFSEHIVEDDATLPTPGIEAARKLVDVDGVPAIIATWSSGVTVAVATSVTIPAGVLQIANGATSPLIAVLPEDEEADLLFRTTASDALQGVIAAMLVAGEVDENYKFETAATLYINNPYGQGLSNAFAEAFERRGGTVHAQVPHPEETQPTYNAQLAEALRNEPDILMAISYPGHSATFLQEARDVFNQTTWQLVDGNKSEDVMAAVGAGDLEGVYGTAPGQDPNIPGFANFSEAYKARFEHDSIPPFTDSAYDAAIVIGLAAAKAFVDGETEITGEVLRDRLRDIANPPGEEIVAGKPENIVRALELIRDGQDIDYSGAAGPVNFDEMGEVITPIEIWQVKGGAFETIQIVSPEDIPAE